MKGVEIAKGDKFKHWTVIRRVNNYKRERAYLCVCDCGNKKILTSQKLRSDEESFCCRECWHKSKIKHGDTCGGKRSTLYIAWDNMNRRCYNKKHPLYKYYGARGIYVCDDWRFDYNNFKRWSLENGWRKGLSIDRINNEKEYSPENCRWTTQKVQANNTRRNTIATIEDITKPCSYWLKYYGVSDWFVRDRMKKYNVTFAEAIQMPRKRKKGLYA